jgi:predicted extracellular nuclease
LQRIPQSQVVNDFVDAVLALDANANVIVLGDLNDFQFSTPVSDVLAADVLIDLVNMLPIEEQYTYVYDGNSEVLDHILLSKDFCHRANVAFDAVHVNAEFAVTDLRPSDHDPVVAVITFGERLYLPIMNKGS